MGCSPGFIVRGDTFKRKRDDGTLAAPINFERNDAGDIVSFMQHGYRYWETLIGYFIY